MRESFDELTRRGAVAEPSAESGREDVGDFFDAWMEEFFNLNELGFVRAGFAVDAGEAGVARLQVGDADCVFVTHPQREIAGGFGEQGEVATSLFGIELFD